MSELEEIFKALKYKETRIPLRNHDDLLSEFQLFWCKWLKDLAGVKVGGEQTENVYAIIYFVSKDGVKMIFLDVWELGSVGGPGKTVANETSEIIKVISMLWLHDMRSINCKRLLFSEEIM